MSECPKCKKLVEALKNIVSTSYYTDEVENIRPMAIVALVEHGKDSPKCSCFDNSGQDCAVHSDSPVSAPKFDKQGVEDAFYQYGIVEHPGPADTYNKKADTFVAGARWQFNQIHPHTKSGGEE